MYNLPYNIRAWSTTNGNIEQIPGLVYEMQMADGDARAAYHFVPLCIMVSVLDS
jgi:hypothetical protein